MPDIVKPVTLALTWNRTIDTLKATLRPAIPVAIGGLFVPCVLAHFALSIASQNPVLTMRHNVETAPFGDKSLFMNLLENLSGFLQMSTAIGFAAFCFSGITYLALVSMAISYNRGIKVISPKEAINLGIKAFFPKGLLIFLFAIILSIEHAILGPFRILTMLTLVAPVILLHDRRGLRFALWNALSLKYATPRTGGRFAVFFILLSLGALVFFSEALIDIAAAYLLHLDESLGFSRGFWRQGLTTGGPLTLIYTLVTALKYLGFCIILTGLASFTTSLYFLLRTPLSQRV